MTDIEPLAVPIPDGARIIGCGRSKLYQLIKEKQIPLIKLGRRSLVPVSSLRALIEAKMKEAA
jgi:excisionase family DNA binding protein